MSETKQCKYCKEEIAYDAKICPNCRKKQKSKKRMVFVIVLIIIIVGAASVAIGSKKLLVSLVQEKAVHHLKKANTIQWVNTLKRMM